MIAKGEWALLSMLLRLGTTRGLLLTNSRPLEMHLQSTERPKTDETTAELDVRVGHIQQGEAVGFVTDPKRNWLI